MSSRPSKSLTNCGLSVNNASDDLDDGITAMDVGSLTKRSVLSSVHCVGALALQDWQEVADAQGQEGERA